MEVKKSDLLKSAQNIQDKNLNRQAKAGGAEKAASAADSKPSLNLDNLRAQVLMLQKDVKDIQTRFTQRQAQVAFADTIQNTGNWQSELKKFMKENFRNVNIPDMGEGTLAEFLKMADEEMQSMRNELIHKEVQLQNIVSSGVIDDIEPADLITKDFESNRDIFNRLKPENVEKLLKSES